MNNGGRENSLLFGRMSNIKMDPELLLNIWKLFEADGEKGSFLAIGPCLKINKFKGPSTQYIFKKLFVWCRGEVSRGGVEGRCRGYFRRPICIRLTNTCPHFIHGLKTTFSAKSAWINQIRILINVVGGRAGTTIIPYVLFLGEGYS